MLNMWPVFVVGIEIGLILAVIAAVLVKFCVAPLIEKHAAIRNERRLRHHDRDHHS